MNDHMYYRNKELLTADGSLLEAVEVEMDASVTSGILSIYSRDIKGFTPV